MREIIERNAEIGNREYRLSLKRQKNHERRLTVIIAIFIISTTCAILIMNDKLMNNAQKSCEELHTHNYCINHI